MRDAYLTAAAKPARRASKRIKTLPAVAADHDRGPEKVVGTQPAANPGLVGADPLLPLTLPAITPLDTWEAAVADEATASPAQAAAELPPVSPTTESAVLGLLRLNKGSHSTVPPTKRRRLPKLSEGMVSILLDRLPTA
ncbi:hypothetical protein WJX72_003456 [[Myrmecia] bisecta]|uniref:Uncharacterized protein n=1 Tax=[Myrmecia] bisecta TaxID=41462 RepID=A0AAW1Q0M3_9CHLO